jgi:hypothetical protein
MLCRIKGKPQWQDINPQPHAQLCTVLSSETLLELDIIFPSSSTLISLVVTQGIWDTVASSIFDTRQMARKINATIDPSTIIRQKAANGMRVNVFYRFGIPQTRTFPM